MKILVLGGTGMAGHTIALYFIDQGYDVTVLARKKINYAKQVIGDVTDFEKLKSLIDKEEYDVIINAIGILNQDAEKHKTKAILINSYLPHFLSENTKHTDTRIIQMSTDCVFSGDTGGYVEDALKDGRTFYDRTKALGELDNSTDLTFRNSIIGPDNKSEGIGLFNWFMKQEGAINGFTNAIWTGVTTITLAKAMHEALSQNLTGLYNLVNNQKISKYELLKLFNKHMKDGQLEILPKYQPIVDKSLVNTRTDFDFEVPDYETMIIEMKDWIETNRKFYPHYFN